MLCDTGRRGRGDNQAAGHMPPLCPPPPLHRPLVPTHRLNPRQARRIQAIGRVGGGGDVPQALHHHGHLVAVVQRYGARPSQPPRWRCRWTSWLGCLRWGRQVVHAADGQQRARRIEPHVHDPPRVTQRRREVDGQRGSGGEGAHGGALQGVADTARWQCAGLPAQHRAPATSAQGDGVHRRRGRRVGERASLDESEWRNLGANGPKEVRQATLQGDQRNPGGFSPARRARVEQVGSRPVLVIGRIVVDFNHVGGVCRRGHGHGTCAQPQTRELGELASAQTFCESLGVVVNDAPAALTSCIVRPRATRQSRDRLLRFRTMAFRPSRRLARMLAAPGGGAVMAMVAWDAVRAEGDPAPPRPSWLSRLRNMDYETRSNLMTWAIVVRGAAPSRSFWQP
jgi:hypothetical protein